MTQRDIVVIGASAGGIQALTALVAGLPRDFPASLLVVVHIPPYAVSRLPEILSRSGPLPAVHAQHGEVIEPGCIYIAPPDRHLLVRTGRIELSRGPRENHCRPAIDPLFRTAARVYGPRVIGIVLSGALYDGSMGLLAIKTRGGMAIVQDPKEAIVDSMPRRAIERVAAEHILPVADIAAAITDLVRRPVTAQGGPSMVNTIDAEERLEAVIAEDFVEQAKDGRTEETTLFTCPDCGGVLWQGGEGPVLRFRCHVGHAFAPEVLLSQKSEELETALWSSLRLLKEKATLTLQLANRTRASGNGKAGQAAERIAEQAELDQRHAQVIQELLEAMPSPMDQAAVVTHAMNDGQTTDRGKAPGGNEGAVTDAMAAGGSAQSSPPSP
jgi:two-component system, chemotaxis family, protein-glutamate methylesterase/glutaminase